MGVIGETYTGDPFTIPSALGGSTVSYTVTIDTGNPNVPVATFDLIVDYPTGIPPTVITFNFDSTKTETIDLSPYFPQVLFTVSPRLEVPECLILTSPSVMLVSLLLLLSISSL